MNTGLAIGLAILAAGLALLVGSLVARSLHRRRVARRDIVRIQRVAQAFDVNPADADILTEVALLGGPTHPALAATDRRIFDAGAALFLIKIFLEEGDVWNSVLALSRLRQRLGFEEEAVGSALPEFLGRVNVGAAGSDRTFEGIVVDRRGAIRLVLPTVPEAGFSRGDVLEIQAGGQSQSIRFRVAGAQPTGTGVTLELQPTAGPARCPRVPTLLPATVRRSEAHADLAPEDATILDLSVGGACVRLPSSVAVDDRVALTFRIASETPVDIAGNVVWSAPAGNGRWRAGIRFDSVPEEIRRDISAFLSVQHLGAPAQPAAVGA